MNVPRDTFTPQILNGRAVPITFLQTFLSECAPWHASHTPVGTVFRFDEPNERFAIALIRSPHLAFIDPKFIP